MNPPMCAQYAMPVPVMFAKVPFTICIKNHTNKNITAGISIKNGINQIINVTILEYQNWTKYAPITADMAPDAPTSGYREKELKSIWKKRANNPPEI